MKQYEVRLMLNDCSEIIAIVDDYKINREARFISTYRKNEDGIIESRSFSFNMLKHIRVTQIEILEDFNT